MQRVGWHGMAALCKQRWCLVWHGASTVGTSGLLAQPAVPHVVTRKFQQVVVFFAAAAAAAGHAPRCIAHKVLLRMVSCRLEMVISESSGPSQAAHLGGDEQHPEGVYFLSHR